MKHLLNYNFDKIVCINLLERPDKRAKMQMLFNNLGIEVEWFNAVQFGFIPKIVEPIVNSKVGHFNKQHPYEIGAALAHFHVIKQALLEGVEQLFVFEDDVMFHNDFNNKLNVYWNDLNPNWDMISFYSFMYELFPENKRISKRWIQSYKSWSLLASGYKKGIMQDYIDHQERFFTIADAVTYKMQEENKWNMYTAIPSLVIPNTDFGSNIRGEQLNYKATKTITNLGYNENNYGN